MAEVTVVPSSEAHKFRVQSWQAGAPLVATARAQLSVEWPVIVGKVAEGEQRILCIGPTDWLVITSAERASTVCSRLQGMAALTGLSVVETTDALTTLRLTGADVRETLAQGTGIDLHPREFPAGRCARTRFAQVPAVLHCLDDGATFECHASCSYQGHLMSWLARAEGQSMPRIYGARPASRAHAAARPASLTID